MDVLAPELDLGLGLDEDDVDEDIFGEDETPEQDGAERGER